MRAHKDRLVSAQTLREGLAALEAEAQVDAPYLPDFAAKRDERLLLEFRRLIREAEVQYVSTGHASELTGWEAATLRKYARRALAGEALPVEWASLVARREGKEFALVLGTIPPKPARKVA